MEPVTWTGHGREGHILWSRMQTPGVDGGWPLSESCLRSFLLGLFLAFPHPCLLCQPGDVRSAQCSIFENLESVKSSLEKFWRSLCCVYPLNQPPGRKTAAQLKPREATASWEKCSHRRNKWLPQSVAGCLRVLPCAPGSH